MEVEVEPGDKLRAVATYPTHVRCRWRRTQGTRAAARGSIEPYSHVIDDNEATLRRSRRAIDRLLVFETLS
jgi:hypothetical protein